MIIVKFSDFQLVSTNRLEFKRLFQYQSANMGQSPSYTIRVLTEDDRDQVLNIRPSEAINRGCDYLPDYYQMLMQSDVTKGYVALLQDRFVSSIATLDVVDID